MGAFTHICKWGCVCATWKREDEFEYTDFEVECSEVDAHHQESTLALVNEY